MIQSPPERLAEKWCPGVAMGARNHDECDICDAIIAAIREALEEVDKIVHDDATAYDVPSGLQRDIAALKGDMI